MRRFSRLLVLLASANALAEVVRAGRIRAGVVRRVLGVMGIAFLAASSVAADQPTTDEDRRRYEDGQARRSRQNLTGWQGLLYYCLLPEDGYAALKDICERTDTNVAFLAAASRVNLTKARNESEFGSMSLGNWLVLEVKLRATKKGPPAAIHASVRAYVSYMEAVETWSFGDEKKGPRYAPRFGDLIVWETSTIGASSGSGEELVVGVSQGIEQNLKQFFADFMNAQKKK